MHAAMKLGKKPAVHDPRVPKLAKFMTTTAPTFPANYDAVGGKGVNWGMMLNDRLGCCTIAGIGHKLQADTKLVRELWSANDNQILGKYESWDGYVDGDSDTDQGGVESDVLLKWLKSRDGFYGHHLVAYGYVDHRDEVQVRHFCAELNGLYIGVMLPISAQSQAVWDVTDASLRGAAAPGSWGGHCVYVYGYTSDTTGQLKTIKFISWGKEMEMTVAFWRAYVDEAWGLLTAALVKNGKVASRLDVRAVEAEMAKLKRAA
jgi:hypothetical protein